MQNFHWYKVNCEREICWIRFILTFYKFKFRCKAFFTLLYMKKLYIIFVYLTLFFSFPLAIWRGCLVLGRQIESYQCFIWCVDWCPETLGIFRRNFYWKCRHQASFASGNDKIPRVGEKFNFTVTMFKFNFFIFSFCIIKIYMKSSHNL